MAGIGFQLRQALRRDSFAGLAQAYGLAGLVAAGPWVFSIVGVLLIGVFSAGVVSPPSRVAQFLVSVTYLMASSLVVTGPLQLAFSRYVADRVYEERRESVLPNLLGALSATTAGSGALGLAAVLLLFRGEGWGYRSTLLATFVTLCDVWLLTVVLSGLKAHRRVLGLYLAGHAISLASALALRPFGLSGLMAGFFAGQAVMLFLMLAEVAREFPSDRPVSFNFLRWPRLRLDLAATGLLFNLGVWADKLVFWLNPATSQPVIGPLRSSLVYDLPVFLAYLLAIPGMAVFLLRVETDFAEHHRGFFRGVQDGASLEELRERRDGMVLFARQGILEILKVQGMMALLVPLAGPRLLELAGISPLYLRLLVVDTLAVGVQVALLAVINVLFYLDKRREALLVSGVFAAANAGLSALTQLLGPQFYGYGFALGALVAGAFGMALLNRRLDRLEFEVFMLQRG